MKIINFHSWIIGAVLNWVLIKKINALPTTRKVIWCPGHLEIDSRVIWNLWKWINHLWFFSTHFFSSFFLCLYTQRLASENACSHHLSLLWAVVWRVDEPWVNVYDWREYSHAKNTNARPSQTTYRCWRAVDTYLKPAHAESSAASWWLQPGTAPLPRLLSKVS